MKLHLALGAVVLCLSELACFTNAYAEIAIIVAADSPIKNISQTELKHIYLGTNRELTNGLVVRPGVLNSVDPLHHEFSQKVLQQGPSEWQYYWSRWLFTGKRVAPTLVPSMHEMIHHVASVPNFLGYVDPSQVTEQVKVLLLIP
jgi:ABC-type phosphate transport system substrate-binding protein